MLNVLLLLLTVGMGGTILCYAHRSLRHEPDRGRFLWLGGVLVVASATFATSTDLLVLAGTWIATSALSVLLVRCGPAPGVRARSRAMVRSFVVGDLALVGAVALLVAGSGSTAIGSVGRAEAPVLAAAGLLLVVAALARSSSGPFTRWLPASTGAPTPSSAMLHAGVVNGGALLLIKLAPATTATLPAAAAATVAGGITVVAAQALAVTRPDLKSRLAWSTTAQMSFTLVLCGLGLHVAAVLHLIAHGFYKGALFLGSGGAVRQTVRYRRAPDARPDRRAVPYALAAAVAAATLLLGADHLTGDLVVPSLLATIAAGAALTGSLALAASRVRLITTASTGLLLLAAYLVLTVQLDRVLAGSLAVDAPALSAWLIAPLLAVLLLTTSAPHRTAAYAPVRAFARTRPVTAPTGARRGHRPSRIPAIRPAVLNQLGVRS